MVLISLSEWAKLLCHFLDRFKDFGTLQFVVHLLCSLTLEVIFPAILLIEL